MPVSFYALIAIIVSSLFLTLLPFLGFPYAWDRAMTAVFGALIFGIAIYSLYRGYVRILARMQRQDQHRRARRAAQSSAHEDGLEVEAPTNEVTD